MSKTRDGKGEPLEELVRNADGSIPDPIGFDPFDTVGVKTRYVDDVVKAHTFPLSHIHCLERRFTTPCNPDLDVDQLVVTSHEPREEHRLRVTLPDTVTNEFYNRLEKCKRVNPEQIGLELE
ncbi:hypothetical protein ACFPM1_11595 [Halorubrum rubrum]|uniref:Uncharacterized protein n=1 Tax=Halorubrum rubrum TaxID=1126240 RepID=A0ABD5R3J7_9EURY|nr:hypothetical protein [Halorubrum rubrum]